MSEPEPMDTVLSVLRDIRDGMLVNFPDPVGDPEFVTLAEAFVRTFAPDGYSRPLPWQWFEDTRQPILDAALATQELRNVTNQNRADLIVMRAELEELREISEGIRVATQNTLSLLFRQFENAFVDDRVNVILNDIRSGVLGQSDTPDLAFLSGILAELTLLRTAESRLITRGGQTQRYSKVDLLYALLVCLCEDWEGDGPVGPTDRPTCLDGVNPNPFEFQAYTRVAWGVHTFLGEPHRVYAYAFNFPGPLAAQEKAYNRVPGGTDVPFIAQRNGAVSWTGLADRLGMSVQNNVGAQVVFGWVVSPHPFDVPSTPDVQQILSTWSTSQYVRSAGDELCTPLGDIPVLQPGDEDNPFVWRVILSAVPNQFSEFTDVVLSLPIIRVLAPQGED